MPFLKKLISIISPAPVDDVLWIFIQCDYCKKKFKVRINKNTDLSSEYNESGDSSSGYILQKEAMDDKCFRLINIRIQFDRKKEILSKDIKGGKFLTKEEFEKSDEG